MSAKNNQGSGTNPLAPGKHSKRSARRKTRNFVSLDSSSRKHRRAKRRLYQNPGSDTAYRQKGKMDFH